MNWYSGWSSLAHVQKLHSFFEIAALVCLACLVITQTAAFKYGRRKDELIVAAEKTTARKIHTSVARSERPRAASAPQDGEGIDRPVSAVRSVGRRLTEPQTHALIAALSPFRGQRVDIVCIYQDEESYEFSKDFEVVFRSAGWDNGGGINQANYDVNPVGIEVTFNQSEIASGRVPRAGEALIAALSSLGLTKKKQGFLSPQAPADRITLRIGQIPPSGRIP